MASYEAEATSAGTLILDLQPHNQEQYISALHKLFNLRYFLVRAQRDADNIYIFEICSVQKPALPALGSGHHVRKRKATIHSALNMLMSLSLTMTGPTGVARIRQVPRWASQSTQRREARPGF